VLKLCEWLQNSALGTVLRESSLWFAVLESLHTLGIVLMAGTIAAVDLRLVGIALRREPVSSVARQLLPWTWAGFALMVATGGPLAVSEAVKLYSSPSFRIKVLLMALAGANALVFHRTIYRSVIQWDVAATPWRARLAGIVSLLCWIGVIAAGRAVGYEE